MLIKDRSSKSKESDESQNEMAFSGAIINKTALCYQNTALLYLDFLVSIDFYMLTLLEKETSKVVLSLINSNSLSH